VDDQRTRPVIGRRGVDRHQIDARRDHLGLRNPADRVVAADDLGVGLSPLDELGRLLAADVGAEPVHHGFLPERPQERELDRLGHEGEPEDEVEHVRARKQPRERAPLRRLPPEEATVPLERPIRFRMKAIALEHDEPGVDASLAQRLHVRPWNPGRVDGAVDDAERPVAYASHSS
jgi:hypothetical protein